jgi:hypothetical protein
MKSYLIPSLVCAALVSGLAFAKSAPDQNPADHKIEILEKDIAATRARTEEVAAQLAETRALLDATLRFLADQAASAKKMSQTLDDSEQAGFTFGINPDSRKILLKGWRDELAAAQKNVPSAPPSKPASKDAKSAGGN